MIVSAVLLSLLMGLAAVALLLAPGIAAAWLLGPGAIARCKFLITYHHVASRDPAGGHRLSPADPLGQQQLAGSAPACATGDPRNIYASRHGPGGCRNRIPPICQDYEGRLRKRFPECEWAARTLGYSAVRTFFQVTLPLSWRGMVAGVVLAFARSLGEFGATTMVSPGINGYRTISLEIFRSVQIPGQESQVVMSRASDCPEPGCPCVERTVSTEVSPQGTTSSRPPYGQPSEEGT